jgi:pimeloyl-ACP methyl ester carboxylesterase
VAIGYVAIAAAVTLTQRQFIYYPDIHRVDPASLGLTSLRPVRIVTSDAEQLVGWWKPPASPAAGVVLYLHGNGGNLADRSHRLGELAAHDNGLLAIDWRGYGGSTGKPTETGLNRDAEAALAWIGRTAPGARVVLFGESLGTGVAVNLASRHPVAGLVLDSPYASVTRLAERQFSWLPVSFLITDRFDAEARIGRVHAPVMIMHCEEDRVIPPAHAWRLYAKANAPKQLWILPGCGHIQTLKRHGPVEAAMYRRIAEWGRGPAA